MLSRNQLRHRFQDRDAFALRVRPADSIGDLEAAEGEGEVGFHATGNTRRPSATLF